MAGTDGIAALIDHTRLTPETTDEDIATLCHEAITYRFAFVCVNPVCVRTAASWLAGSPVGVCSVVGFPLGATPSAVKVFETRRAVEDGAGEVDMVIHVGALKSGALQRVEDDIAAVVQAGRESGAGVKVIIEAGLLTDAEKVAACELARRAGARFVKTSTGFGPRGATVADVMLMRRAVGPEMGVKAAGGIRSLAAFRSMVAAGATRVGTSAGVTILREAEMGE